MCLPGTAETVREQAPPLAGRRLDRRTALLGGLGATVTAAFPARAFAAARPRHVQDLTHVFRAGFPVYTFDPPVRETTATHAGEGYYAQRWTFGEHSGTHMDAPGHFVPGGRLATDIRPRELIVPIVVVDISARAARNPDATVTVDDLRRFERRHGRVPQDALVCMHSGWATRAADPARFKGGAEPESYHFPGFSSDAAMWLVRSRDITAIGVDTLSLDPGTSRTFPVHYNFLRTDRYGLENLRNLNRIPPRGATAYVGLIPWEQGSGGPVRVLATW